MHRQSEPLQSLHAQPRGLQADTSAVAVAEHCSFIDDLSSKGLRCSPAACETRVRVEALSSLQFNRRCLAWLQHMLRTSLAPMHSSSASQSSSSIALYSAVFSRL